jgi:F0F1-type ATP synthase assembly protein I
MAQVKAPKDTLTPKQGVAASPQPAQNKAKGPTAVFITMALDMSWRLAIVVLLPIIGGYKLDEHYKHTPLLTILGFIVAIIGIVLVLRSTLQAANNAARTKE